jgi:DNA-binding transcriptional MerR regulator
VLTISQLAAYAGVTVAAVRHYHRIGLLPEPERDRSGYRSYDAAAVVRTLRVHVLASAGVPLAQVQDLLDADPEVFADRVRAIDARLRSDIQRLQHTRERLARLAAGDHLALPPSVVGYLDRLRGLGVEDGYLELERNAWIMVAAQVPDRIDAIIAKKHADLDDPDMLQLYVLLNSVAEWTADDPRVVEVADTLDRIRTRAERDGDMGPNGFDDQFTALLDAAMEESSPASAQLLALLHQRGWRGWTRAERIASHTRTR